MGFGDRLKEIGKGIGDLVTAPIGLFWDTVRAVTSEEYNPGFFGVFGPATEQGLTGLAKIGEGTGINNVVQAVGETPFGEGLKSFWDEAELLYSTEFQRTEQQAPWGLRSVFPDLDPAEFSVQRAVAGGMNVLGSLKPGGAPGGDVQDSWRRAGNQSIGQSFYESILTDFSTLSPSLQAEVKASGHYNMITGTIDAVARWFLSPDVLLGKGLKHVRQRSFILDSGKNLELANRRLGGSGLHATRSDEGLGGMRSVTLGAVDDSKRLWAVERGSSVEQLIEEGQVKIAAGMDEALDADEVWLESESLAGRVTQETDSEALFREIEEIRTQLGPDAPTSGDPMGDVLQHYATSGMADDLTLFNALDDILQGVDQGDLASMHALLDAMEAGGASPNLVSTLAEQLQRRATASGVRRANQSTATQGIRPVSTSTQRPLRFAGTQARPVVLFTDAEDARRYASRLYEQDPSDMPVLLDMKANGMNAIYEEFDLPVAERGGDGAFFTLAENIQDQEVKIHRFSPDVLDPATQTKDLFFEPETTRNLRIYNQDGSAIEPDQVIGFEDLRMDFEAVARLDGEGARKYLLARREQEMGSSQNLYQEAMSNRKVHQYLNAIGRMRSADEVRRQFFPNHPLGQRIATDMFDAKTFDERRSVLAAYMGYRTPELDMLPDITKARINILMREMENVRAGGRPNDVYLALIDEPGKYTNLAPEDMMRGFNELLGELQDQDTYQSILRAAQNLGPLRQLSVPYNRLASGAMRRTKFYQESPLMRPVRIVVEMKPHRFMNVRDGMSDVQLVRQLEEAQKLGITPQEISGIREEYMRAATDQEKVRIVTDAENLIIRRAANKAKLTEEEFQTALQKAQFGRRRVQEYLTTRKYSGGDRDLLQHIDDDTGELINQHLPLLDTQIQAWIPLQDVRSVIKTASRIGKVRQRFGLNSPMVPELINSFYAAWKPTVLLRGGWMLRVVSDEQLRILARQGSLLRHLAAIEAGGTTPFSGIFGKDLTFGQRTAQGFSTITGTQPIVGLSTRVASAISFGARKLHLVDPKYYDYIKGLEIENLVSARIGYGGPNEALLQEMSTLFGRTEDTIFNHLSKRSSGEWKSVVQGSREFAPAWHRVLVNQFGQSPLGRDLVQNILVHTRGKGMHELNPSEMQDVVNKFKHFLTDTKEGREIAANMPWRSAVPEKWAEALIEDLADYTGGFNDALMDGILARKVTNEQMEALDEALRPDIVHAEIIDQDLGRGVVVDNIRDFVEGAFDLMGRMPTDTLSRQPMFKQLYGLEMIRIEKLRKAQGLDLTESSIESMSRQARSFAINETRTYLYDLAEISRFGDMFRWIAPFYAAWQEVIKVWGQISFNDPSVIARARILWNAPNKADMVYTDQEGEEYIQFRLSEKMADNLNLTGWQRYAATGGLRVGKSSFNLVLNNPLPSVGPLIAYPVNEIVKKKPSLEAGLRFLLPFGVSTDSSVILLSPLVRQLKTEMEGPQSSLNYQRAWTDAITWMDVEYRSGRRTDPPTEEEAHDIARKLHTFRLITRLSSPAQPIFDSPLQPYIDAYRDMNDQLGPESADEAFLNEYGNEFFAVTLSRSVSATGIPPTVEAEMNRDKFEALIKSYPEYGRLILGDEALGEFSTAAYAGQLERPVDPDNPFSEMERVYRPTELDPRTGRIMEVDRRLGWQEFIRVMDGIDLLRKQQGLPNLRVNAASQLKAYRDQLVQRLATEYPSWWEDYNTRDELKWPDRISAFREIAKDPLMQTRADIQGLQDYLALREAVLQELNRRKMLGGASTLEAVANMDLQNAFDTQVNAILDDNVAFTPLYFRYLEGDTLALRNNG